MTDVKRHFNDISSGSPALSESPDSASRKHVKPGRKPVESEPKSKRTAQNRAAQRAYRERKEKKMKDLEDKVKLLEDENLKINTESDFLKAQIDILKNELVKYKGGSASNFNLPTLVDSRSLNSSINDSSPDTDVSDGLLRSEFPWSKNNLQFHDSLNLGGGSSSSESPLNENILFDNNQKYDEKLDPFCSELNEACGTKDKPVPKYRKPLQTESTINKDTGFSPFGFFNNDQVFGDNFSLNLTPKNDDNDPLSFLNDNTFDVNLAFDDKLLDNKESLIDNLVTEESLYDPLRDQQANNFNFNDFVKTSFSDNASSVAESKPGEVTNPNTNDNDNDNDDDEVVPAPEKTFRCSEIWDRITSHPRYTEIDIDGLCSELKSKARCSEKGVVVNAHDVNMLLQKSASER